MKSAWRSERRCGRAAPDLWYVADPDVGGPYVVVGTQRVNGRNFAVLREVHAGC